MNRRTHREIGEGFRAVERTAVNDPSSVRSASPIRWALASDVLDNSRVTDAVARPAVESMRTHSDRTARARARSRAWVGVALLAVTALVGACVGDIDDPPAATTISPTSVEVVTNRFPRLSHRQWELTVMDLFGLSEPTGLSASFAPDALGGKAFDNDQSVLSVSPSLWRDYQTAAETIAERVTSDPALLAHILPRLRSSDVTYRARRFIESFGLRVFRKPLTDADIASRLALFERGAKLHPELDPFLAGVRVSISAFLQSPYFVYRVELGATPVTGAVGSLSDWEVASRLSYAIWNSMPDDELFRAAGAGELSTSAGLHAAIERMLDTPRAHAAVAHFFDQLYGGAQYESMTKDATLYPDFVPEVGGEMRTELGKFTESVYAEGGGLRELLTSTTSFVTPRLASIYGLSETSLAAPDADGFSRVTLDPSERSGLLTRSGFLAWKSTESDPKTIQRGVFITRRIVCQKLGDPPAAAQGATIGGQPTDRERVDALTGPGTCGAACHGTYMNPAGFAFEHYGAMGEFRSVDGGSPVDSSATFPLDEVPLSYGDAAELSRGLAESPQVHACFTGYLFEYLLGREPVASDDVALSELAATSLSGASARELFVTALESQAARNPLIVSEAQ